MGLLLALPAVIGPGIALHVIGAAGGEKAHLARPDQGTRINFAKIH
jgi:hypothetical protein